MNPDKALSPMIALVILSLSEGIWFYFRFVVYPFFFLSRTNRHTLESHQLILQFLQIVCDRVSLIISHQY